MISELFKTIFNYSQTLGKEDVLTAIIAAMFSYSKELMYNFLDHPKIKCPETIIKHIHAPNIKTGITYFSKLLNQEDDYQLRPDLMITNSGYEFSTNDPFVLIESKIYSSLTTNQYKGYPAIKANFKESAHLILISNYFNANYRDYFDSYISWNELIKIVSNYLQTTSNLSEKVILNELLKIFYSIGVEFNEYVFVDIEDFKPVENAATLSFFVKAMRKNLKMTQEEFAKEVGVGLRFIRELEQGNKSTLRTDKINIVLEKFGCELGPIISSKNNIDKST